MEQSQQLTSTTSTIDGKKKFTATLVSIAASLVGLFFTPETAEPLVQCIAVAGPLVLGFLYDWFQSRHDVKKKEVEFKQAEVSLAQVQNGNAQQGQPTIDYRQPTIVTPFDPEAFHTEVLAEVEKRYSEVNPATIYYMARDKGLTAPCGDISQAQDYWDYLAALVTEADKWLEEQTKQEGPCSKQSPAYYALHRDYQRVIRKRNDLEAVVVRNVPWQLKLSSQHQTLYYLGELSEELLR